MRTSSFVLTVVGLSVSACGSPSSDSGQVPNNGTSGGASGAGAGGTPAGGNAGTTNPPSGNGGGGNGGTGAGGSGAGGSGAGVGGGGVGGSAAGTSGASGGPATDPPGTVTITTDPFVLQPGSEVHKCQNFDNPFGNQDVAIQRIVSDMAKGSHHLHLYNLTVGTGRTLEDCDVSDFHALVHAAGSPHAETQYPAGMARKIRGSKGLRMQLHYLNTGREPLTAQASIKLSPVDASTVTKWVAQLYLNRVYLSVPPGAGRTITTTCSIPSVYGPISLIGAGSHMHMRGVHFVANTNKGVKLIETEEWDEPPGVTYDPPIVMNPGDAVTWTCTYDNETAQPITFGPSAAKNEMCIYIASYYSSSPDATQLECQATSAMSTPAAPARD
jgi:hypothetical protein